MENGLLSGVLSVISEFPHVLLVSIFRSVRVIYVYGSFAVLVVCCVVI